jgi:hypothetical protein
MKNLALAGALLGSSIALVGCDSSGGIRRESYVCDGTYWVDGGEAKSKFEDARLGLVIETWSAIGKSGFSVHATLMPDITSNEPLTIDAWFQDVDPKSELKIERKIGFTATNDYEKLIFHLPTQTAYYVNKNANVPARHFAGRCKIVIPSSRIMN